MDNYSSDEEELEMKNFHGSVNYFNRKNPISLEEDQRNYRKRSSSLSLNLPKNFVPKLKPIKTIICPSPIDLNDNSPPPISDTSFNNEQFLESPTETKKVFNIKPIKFMQVKKRNLKKSSKILSVEEETHETEAISDYEDKPKKAKIIDFDSDTSDNDIKDNQNSNCNKKKDILKNINVIREEMTIIRKNSIKNEYDDSNIGHNYASKKLNQHKNIYQQKCTDERKNKNLIENNLNSIKNRTRSFNIKQRYVSTILGFLEKNHSTNSLNSNGK